MKRTFAISAAIASMLVGATAASADDGPRRDRDRTGQQVTTSTSGGAITTRRGGAAYIDTRGAARGDGAVRSESEGEVFSSTTRDGSDADAYGYSRAEADEPRRERRRSRPRN